MQVLDAEGNTPLHCAAMSNQPNALDLVKMLLLTAASAATAPGQTSSSSAVAVVQKNRSGQTAYDVAVLNSVRQFLLPLQLQAETQAALDNGGAGLPPGIDLGGLKINNAHLPPPPVMGMMGGMTQMPPNGMYPPTPGLSQHHQQQQQPMYPPAPQQQQQHVPNLSSPQQQVSPPYAGATSTPPPPQDQQQDQLQPAPSSGSGGGLFPRAPTSTGSQHSYALTGRSSAATLRSKSGIQPDGFHSSSSDKNLQEKYGNVNANQVALPPPPSSGNFAGLDASAAGPGLTTHSAPPSMNTNNNGAAAAMPNNPFAGGLSALGAGSRVAGRRYVAYDPYSTGRSPLPRPPAPTTTGMPLAVPGAVNSNNYNAATFQPQISGVEPAQENYGAPAPYDSYQQQQQGGMTAAPYDGYQLQQQVGVAPAPYDNYQKQHGGTPPAPNDSYQQYPSGMAPAPYDSYQQQHGGMPSDSNDSYQQSQVTAPSNAPAASFMTQPPPGSRAMFASPPPAFGKTPANTPVMPPAMNEATGPSSSFLPPPPYQSGAAPSPVVVAPMGFSLSSPSKSTGSVNAASVFGSTTPRNVTASSPSASLSTPPSMTGAARGFHRSSSAPSSESASALFSRPAGGDTAAVAAAAEASGTPLSSPFVQQPPSAATPRSATELFGTPQPQPPMTTTTTDPTAEAAADATTAAYASPPTATEAPSEQVAFPTASATQQAQTLPGSEEDDLDDIPLTPGLEDKQSVANVVPHVGGGNDNSSSRGGVLDMPPPPFSRK